MKKNVRCPCTSHINAKENFYEDIAKLQKYGYQAKEFKQKLHEKTSAFCSNKAE